MKKAKVVKLLALSIVVALIAVGCGFLRTSKPVITLVQPVENTVLPLNQPVIIESSAASANELNRIELWVNGALVDVKSIAGQQTTASITQSWTPTEIGEYRLEVRAVDVDGVESDAALVVVSVGAPATQLTVVRSTFTPAADTPAAETLPDATDTPVPPTAVPPTATPAPTDTPAIAILTTKADLNVRAGASTQFEVIGILPFGMEARILGVNEERTWWLIEFQGVPNNQGWVSAKETYSTAKNTENVPVVQAPATPTPSPTPTGTPTATPTVVALPDFPIIHYFRADKLNIAPGETVLLQWDVDGADQLFLYPGGDGGVIAPGDMQVKPDATTVYRLVASNARGTVEATITIIVSQPTPTVLYDFIAMANAAEWKNGSGEVLPWQGETNDARGFARLPENATLEDGIVASQVLETHPQWIADGEITGAYPVDFEITSGDKFIAEVGYLKGATFSGGVIFRFCYYTMIAGDCLGEVTKEYTGTLKTLEVDLSSLNGYNSGWFVLAVNANGSANQDWAVWVNPRIERP